MQRLTKQLIIAVWARCMSITFLMREEAETIVEAPCTIHIIAIIPVIIRLAEVYVVWIVDCKEMNGDDKKEL